MNKLVSTLNMLHQGQKNRAIFNKLKENSYDINSLRTNEALPDEAWETIDNIVKRAKKPALTFTNTLENYGMVNDSRTLADVLIKWYEVAELDKDPTVSIMGDEATDNERPDWSMNALPLPVIHKDFFIPWRLSQVNEGEQMFDIPREMIFQYTRKIAETVEDMNLNGSDITLNGYGISGATNHTDINTGSLTDDWADTGESEHIMDDVLTMKQVLVDLDFPESGPYALFIPSRFSSTFEKNFTDYYGQTIRERVLSITGIDDIVVCPDLPDENDDGVSTNYVMLMYMSPEVMTVERAVDLQPISWETNGGMVEHYKLFSAQVPKVTSGPGSDLGIAYYNG